MGSWFKFLFVCGVGIRVCTCVDIIVDERKRCFKWFEKKVKMIYVFIVLSKQEGD